VLTPQIVAGRYLGPDLTVIYDMSLKTCLRALVAASTVLLFACGSAAAPAAHNTLVLGEADAGRTVQAKVGDTVQVKLQESFPVPGSSLVWEVSSSAPSVLTAGRVTRDPAERPRIGQVAYTAEFTAKAGGQAQLIARGSTTCEAMAKEGCPNHDFTITVTVS
jgi:predicted secreted protein